MTKPNRIPIGTSNRPIILDTPQAYDPPVPSAYSDATGISLARVNAIGNNEPTIIVNTSAHPLGARALKNVQVAKFSGKSEDWPAFARRWQHYLRLEYECGNGQDISDCAALTALREVLDTTNQVRLDTEMARDPKLQYYKFFDKLRALYGKDMQPQNRQNWLLEKLHHNGQRPTLQEWDSFEARYKQKRDLVEGWSHAEDRLQVQKQLTRELQGWVLDEEYKKREKIHRGAHQHARG